MTTVGKLPCTQIGQRRLSGVQALRGVAASSVVLCHAARHVDKAFGAPALIVVFQPGHAGVDLFFVISGFIILFVHRKDIGCPGRLGHYLGRRFNRVYPLYWLALCLTVAMSLAGGHGLPSVASVLRSVSLVPSFREPLLGVAWTLQYEIVFYAVFAVAIARRVVGMTFAAAWLTLVLASAVATSPTMLPQQIHGAYCIEFFLGMAAASVVARARRRRPGAVVGAGAALFLLAYGLESFGVLDGYGTAARLAYGIPAFLVVVGIAQIEQVGGASFPRWLQDVGEASYSIYLFQFVFIGVVWQVWVRAGLPAAPFACFALLASVAIGGGVLVSRWVERPLLRVMRRQSSHGAG